MPDYYSGEHAATIEIFQRFQKELLNIKKAARIDDILDQMEVLLDMAIESMYARVYLVNADGSLDMVRDMAPVDLALDPAYMRWALENQEATAIPVEDAAGDHLHSLLFLPLVGNVGCVGITVLWVDCDVSELTQGLFGLLNILAHETASCVEAQRLRDRLEENKARMIDVVESVPHGIMAIGQKRIIELINGTMEVMLDVRRDDVIGNPYEKVLPPQAAKNINTMIRSGNGEETELVLDVSGSEAVFGLTLTPMRPGPDGQPTGYVLLCRDLMLSREVNKLREIDALKNDFLSLVSHELRTPLTSIMAYTETLLMDGMVPDPNDRIEYLGIIYNEGERLTRLINDVLDLTKMEAGKMEYIYSECNVNDIVYSAVTNSTAAAEKKKHKVVLKIDDSLPTVRCDSDRIMQVMINLLSNAIKYTNDGGIIEVGSKIMESEDTRLTHSVYIWVKDNGIGIAPEHLNRVFSRFEQIESMDHHSTGTGLGMPICRMIVEQGHGGHIDLESSLGVGSTFYFTLPII